MTDPWGNWTIEGIVDRLKELAATHLRSSQIAEKLNHEFGTVFTRNAIIGKRSRLGLDQTPGFKSTKRVYRPCGNPDTATVRPRRQPPPVTLPTLPANAPCLPASPSIAPSTTSCTIDDLDNWTCRWPIGDPLDRNFHFCGVRDADLMELRPYCDHHARTALNRLRANSKERRYG